MFERGLGTNTADRAPSRDYSEIRSTWCAKKTKVMIYVVIGLTSIRTRKRGIKGGIVGRIVKRIRG